MTKAYGAVPSPRSLAPRERDASTGRRAGRRDDKHRSSDQAPARRPRSRRLLIAALVGIVLLGGAAAAAVMVSSSDDGSGDAAAQRAAERRALALVPGPTVASPAFEDPPATAITLTYRGGRFTRKECTNLLGGGCEDVEFDFYDSLTLRCTPDGCVLQDTGIGEAPLTNGAASVSGTHPHGSPECGTQDTSISVRAVGSATTHGIEHPARLVGRATNEAPASVHPTANCLGRSEVYEFDATPS